MTLVDFEDRWRSGKHVGMAKPRTVAKIQRGHMKRGYRKAPFDDDFGYIGASKHNAKPWQSWWEPYDDWVDLPNVQHVETSTEFQQQSGMADPESATITIDNLIYEEVFGVGGPYHRFARGYLSPWRGWTSQGLRDPIEGVRRNEWFDVLNGGYRLRIWQGYGDALVPAFTGLIDDTSVGDTPDTITLSCRSFGALLTDQRVFGDNKAKELRAPIVFHDRLRADATKVVSGGANASTFAPEHPPINVTKSGAGVWWLSHAHTTEDNTEWVQIRLPQGRYTQFYVNPGYDGMEMYVSVFVRHRGMKTRARVDGTEVDDGWISTSAGAVPGDNGGHPYVYRWRQVAAGGMKRELPFTLECGDDTVLRVSFRKLGRHAQGDYRAKCSRLAAFKAKRKPSATKKHWILVDDASDIIKWCLLWAGFKSMDVEPMGVRLKGSFTVDQTMFLSDVIRTVVDKADFTFFIDGFDDSDQESIGIPHFQPVRAIRAPDPGMVEIRDSDLLTGLDVRFTKEPLAYIIRVRGKQTTEKDPEQGVTLGGDLSKRPMGVYRPPWSDAHYDVASGQRVANYPFHGRLAGLRRHVVHTDNAIENYDEAMMACILIAMRQALAALGAQAEIPGHPGISLNGQVSIIDEASGANTRMWVTKRSTTFTAGEQAEFKSTIGGAMVDSPDLFTVALDYLYFLDKVKEESAL